MKQRHSPPDDRRVRDRPAGAERALAARFMLDGTFVMGRRRGRADIGAWILGTLVAATFAHGADGGAGYSPGDRRTLASFPAAGGGIYELSLEACKKGEQEDAPRLFRCPFSIRLVAGGKVVRQELLPYLACGEPVPMKEGRLLGGDPVARAWTTRDDRCEVQVAARAVEMAPGITALLVTQRNGQEAYYRRHQLFLATGGVVKEVWQHTEAQGQAVSSVSVLPAGRPHCEDVALIELTTTDQSQALTATRLHLDPSGTKISASPLPDAADPLYVVVANDGKQGDDCLAGFQSLDARLFPDLRRHGFFPGMVLATRQQAQEALDRVTACAGALGGAIHVQRRKAGRGR
jgi:hypothetical protein